MIKTTSAHGKAKNEAEPVTAASVSAVGGEDFGHPGVAVTFVVNEPSGYRLPTVADTRTESPGRITGSFGAGTDASAKRPVTLSTEAALIRTLPVLATE